jgi:hypothetical protein
MKATGCRFDSATHVWRRVRVGGARHGSTGRAVAAQVLSEKGDDPGWAGWAKHGPRAGRTSGEKKEVN